MAFQSPIRISFHGFPSSTNVDQTNVKFLTCSYHSSPNITFPTMPSTLPFSCSRYFALLRISLHSKSPRSFLYPPCNFLKAIGSMLSVNLHSGIPFPAPLTNPSNSSNAPVIITSRYKLNKVGDGSHPCLTRTLGSKPFAAAISS